MYRIEMNQHSEFTQPYGDNQGELRQSLYFYMRKADMILNVRSRDLSQ